MKQFLILILALFMGWTLKGQNYIRQSKESKEQFVARILDSSEVNGGVVYESGSADSSFIIFFPVNTKDKSAFRPSHPFLNPSIGLDVQESGTWTTFQLLYATDKRNYTKYTIDTLDANSGCCPCWQPATVDHLFMINVDEDPELEICVVLYNHVLPTCNSMGYAQALFYDDLRTFQRNQYLRKFNIDIDRSFYSMTEAETKKQIITSLKKQKTKQNIKSR